MKTTHIKASELYKGQSFTFANDPENIWAATDFYYRKHGGSWKIAGIKIRICSGPLKVRRDKEIRESGGLLSSDNWARIPANRNVIPQHPTMEQSK